MRTTIIIPSVGRIGILGETLLRIANQKVKPLEVLVVVPSVEDAPESVPDYVRVILSEKGSCHQRNVGIKNCCSACEFIVFMDDDTFLHPEYIERVEKLFTEKPELSGLTGHLLRNGDVSVEEADALLAEYRYPEHEESNTWKLSEGLLYGCNSAVRRASLENVRFDERLVLYGWLEDADFSHHLSKHGLVCYSPELIGVHLMYPSGGRSNHVRFGFSQIMNPFYLHRKNGPALRFSEVLRGHWGKAVAANLVRSMIGNNKSVRRDRLRGNMVAFKLLILGRVEPEYAKEL